MAENNPTLLLFDVSPFLYIGYWGAVLCLKTDPQYQMKERLLR